MSKITLTKVDFYSPTKGACPFQCEDKDVGFNAQLRTVGEKARQLRSLRYILSTTKGSLQVRNVNVFNITVNYSKNASAKINRQYVRYHQVHHSLPCYQF